MVGLIRTDDGYRLTYGGLDYLALHTFTKRESVYSVGNQIGVGKESDIYAVAASTGEQRILKIHRLGRISFRTVKSNRDYLRKRNAGSWMYMSRLAAMKEFAFMQILRDHGFPVPEPIDQSRHCIVMSMIDAFPLRQVKKVADPPKLYAELMALIIRFAEHGLIHGDFNEFNILVYEDTQEAVVIDFPQMVSIDHANAKEYFNRDVECIKRFFKRTFGFTSDAPGPFLEKDVVRKERLDVLVEASGFTKKQLKELEVYRTEVLKNDKDDDETGEGAAEDEEEGSGDEEEEEESEEEEQEEEPKEELVKKFGQIKVADTGKVDKFGNTI